MFVFAGSRPPRPPPVRSVSGCQQLFCSPFFWPSAGGCGSGRATVATRTAADRPRRPDGVAGMDQVRPLDRRLRRPGQRLHQPHRRQRAQRAAGQPVGDYWGSLRPSRTGTAAPRASRGRARSSSWVMARSGYSAAAVPARRPPRQLPRRALRPRASSEARRFCLHAPNEYSPKPGDLVCTGTAGPTWRHADSRTARRRIDNTANHCDVVTDVRGGFVHAVGGNVKNSVTMSLYPVDSRGRLQPVGGRPWLLVVEKRG